MNHIAPTLTLPRLPSAGDHYCHAVYPLALNGAKRAGDYPDDQVARRSALWFSLNLAEYAADQADEAEIRKLLDALMRARLALAEILNPFDAAGAAAEGEKAADALRTAAEDLIESWGLEA